MKTITFLDWLTQESRSCGTNRASLFSFAGAPSRRRSRDLLPLREAIPLWFALSSPLTGLIIGFLGAWLLTRLTSYECAQQKYLIEKLLNKVIQAALLPRESNLEFSWPPSPSTSPL